MYQCMFLRGPLSVFVYVTVYVYVYVFVPVCVSIRDSVCVFVRLAIYVHVPTPVYGVYGPKYALVHMHVCVTARSDVGHVFFATNCVCCVVE